MNTKFDITQFDPCDEGLEYYNEHSTPEQAWNDCQRGDWMLWIANKLAVDDRLFTKAKALCANTVRHLMKDKRSTDAIDVAMRYANGEITREELNKYITAASYAADAATDVASAAYNATTYTYAASAYAATAASAVAYAIDTAATSAASASAAASDAADASSANYQATADICREVLTEEVFEKLKNYEQPN
jgi:hypothetical protein